MEIRQMHFPSELKIRESESGKKIEGYFIVYNQKTNLFGNIYEQMAKGSIDNALANNDIRCLFDHDSAKVLGRTGNGTLKLKSDDYGLYGEVEINQNDQEAKDIHARVERGDINACSFGFYPIAEERTEESDGSITYTVKEADVIEVSVVTFPAYPQTQVSARKKEVETFKREKLEARKEDLKKKLKGETQC
ncbi:MULTISPECIES: HK97 family phage prohead protease [unclassified Breznakia]|uniref:HK97 family phage prohead protease n=1 Tax=unclassified Breznakia TaxID=2623764 RepID=UPI00247584FD|nr:MULTISPECIES: HK97 family phage prohead protease [unclassified Breznakia]MDH6367140.1 HK97 family phage prohead protease [Breznakia sp. PH1-1]MDH6404273.1 HK97 family phage prohead protease [Breznakia sp. PF1-11]MDH6412028.1 HK97 family phage prohead protease [Breznakia sp. PFB1-11]MDH6414261.1 HK97 family phage prohead protease [Breznakia sp. PFB1-14]MDH6416642.1 HK97 family phage prohead protease [Breznakia sp. PFB1-4]